MLRDAIDFERRVAGAESALQRFFDADGPVTVTRAPGRLEIIGGFAGLFGGLVVETTTAEGAHIALQKRDDGAIRIWERRTCSEGTEPFVSTFAALTGKRSKALAHVAEDSAAAIIARCYAALVKDGLLPKHVQGANIVVECRGPGSVGAGVAIAVASIFAISERYDLELCPDVIETVASRCTNTDPRLAITSEPGLIYTSRRQKGVTRTCSPLPVRLFGVEAGVRLAKADVLVSRSTAAVMMGRKILNRQRASNGLPPVQYLCDLTQPQFRRDYVAALPSRISGAEFTDMFGDLDDRSVAVEPKAKYPVRAATEQVVYDNARAVAFSALMEANPDPHSLVKAGEMLYGSNWSHSRSGLGSRETTMIVRLAKQFGAPRGIYGASVSGPGCGGTVVLLTAGDDALAAVKEIAANYAEATSHAPQVLTGARSPGAITYGSRTVVLP